MYAAPNDKASRSGAWTSIARQSSVVRNTFREVRNVKWKELEDIQHLADGAMCSCYTAMLNGEPVVIKKRSRTSHETKKEIERQLHIEQAYLSHLDHPNIIRLIGAGRRGFKNEFEPFLVLEYLEGGTLDQIIQKRRRRGGKIEEEGVPRRRAVFELPHYVDVWKNYIPWAKAMGWAKDMAKALRYMHEEADPVYAYVCRDLKPDNIGFTADGTLKIFDFGLAKKIVRWHGKDHLYTMTNRTGTVRYMAPEAFLGTLYNEKVDVFAWSHVVAEMLSLEAPYFHMSMYDFREKVALQHERPHVEQRWPRTIKKLLRRCWEASPDKRPSFKEILESHVLDEAAGPALHPTLQFCQHLALRFNPSLPQEAAADTKAVNAAAALRGTAAEGEINLGAGYSARGDQQRASAPARASGRAFGAVQATSRASDHADGGEGEWRRGDLGVGAVARTLPREKSVEPMPYFRIGPFRLPMCFFGQLPHLQHQHGRGKSHDTSIGSGEDTTGKASDVGVDDSRRTAIRNCVVNGNGKDRHESEKTDALELKLQPEMRPSEEELIRAQAC